MVNIKCYKCGGKASGTSFEDARTKLNHAVGLSRGIKCGDNYNCIEEIVDKIKDPKALKPETPKENDQDDSPKADIPEPVSSEASYQKVEGKSGEHVTFDEAKQSKNKSKKIHSY